MTECTQIPPDTLLVKRRYVASRERVWAAWTEPERLLEWFGSGGYTLEAVDIDLRVGGGMRKQFRTPEGDQVVVSGVYREVIPNERLVYTWTVDGPGRDALDSLVTVELIELPDGTELSLRHEGLTSEKTFASHKRGWTDNMDQLAPYVEASA